MKNSKVPSLENWNQRTSNWIAHRLRTLARTNPPLYAYFKACEAYYFSQALDPDSNLRFPQFKG